MVYFKANLAESSKECYGSKRAALPMMLLLLMMMTTTTIIFLTIIIPENCYLCLDSKIL
jgi:hypothetical protein